MARLGGCIACARDQTLQVAAFVLSALSSACMLYRWSTLDKEGRKRVWGLYGWFCGLMCAGSCCGAVAWVAWMQYLVLYFADDTASFALTGLAVTFKQTCLQLSQTYLISLKECHACNRLLQLHGPRQVFECKLDLLNSALLGSDLTVADAFAQQSSAYYYLSVYPVPYALEFFCLSVAKLLVLHRILHVALPRAVVDSQRSVAAGRLLVCSVIAVNLVSVSGSVGEAVYWKRVSNGISNANEVNDGIGNTLFANWMSAVKFASICQFCEVAMLLLIITVFLVLGALCARRMRVALRSMSNDASDQLRAEFMSVRRQILVTVCFVFTTFVLRAVSSTMFAAVNSLANDPQCSYCESSCNVAALAQTWYVLTPEFQLSIIFVSSPFTMLITLWGMTTSRALQLMRGRSGDIIPLADSPCFAAGGHT